MNNALRETMCARMSLVPELQLETNNGIETKISHTLEEVHDLLKNIRSGTVEPLEAAKTALEISNTANESYQSLRYLEDRLKIVRTFLSQVESALAERHP